MSRNSVKEMADMKWDYVVDYFTYGDEPPEELVRQMQRQLNHWGAKGWEVVGVSNAKYNGLREPEEGLMVILKQPR
jgi:hypothetical protein